VKRWLKSGWLPLLTLVFMACGALILVVNGSRFAAAAVWWLGLAIVGTPVVAQTIREVASGRFAVDLVATLAIVLAFVLWQPLAGLVIVLMQSGGEALERYAERKATDAVRALEDAAPRIAHAIWAKMPWARPHDAKLSHNDQHQGRSSIFHRARRGQADAGAAGTPRFQASINRGLSVTRMRVCCVA